MKENLNFKKILVTTDFSEESKAAFPYSKYFAKNFGSEIYLVHVLEKKLPYFAVKSIDLNQEKILSAIEKETNEKLNEFVEQLKEDPSWKVFPILLRGVDYEEIISFAEKESIDLIIIATKGERGVMRALIGSVAEKVVRNSKKPVLVVTPTYED
jgi:nucleotide-binding universal stress UspA family protein